MKLHIGTSGYSYKEWKGSFYPADLSAKKMLDYYAERFDTVEINGSFYRLPTVESVESWTHQVPKHFRFILKAPQLITHIKRLKAVEQPIADFLKVSAALGDHLGPLFFQLPPNMKKDVARLCDTLALIPAPHRVAFEFRHASWFDDEVFDILNKSRAALCIADTDDAPPTPLQPTAKFGYLRLRRADYTDAALKKWLKQINDQPWTEAFIFFKHEDEAKGPRFAERLTKLAEKPKIVKRKRP